MKHTPGPWMVGSSDASEYMGDMGPDGLYVQQSSAGRSVICEMDQLTENRAANASLIAAAPELLEALQILLADMEQVYRDKNGDMDHNGIEMARAAIARVEGRE